MEIGGFAPDADGKGYRDGTENNSTPVSFSLTMIRKGQIKNVEKGNVLGQISFIKEIFGIAA